MVCGGLIIGTIIIVLIILFYTANEMNEDTQIKQDYENELAR
jgi:hypothetical protein